MFRLDLRGNGKIIGVYSNVNDNLFERYNGSSNMTWHTVGTQCNFAGKNELRK